MLIFLSAFTIFLTHFSNQQKSINNKPNCSISKIVSVDSLKSVKIGNQIWSAENISIPIKESVCYENNSSNSKTFGQLYTFEQALEVVEKFPGWRLPTKEDILELIKYLGGNEVAGAN